MRLTLTRSLSFQLAVLCLTAAWCVSANAQSPLVQIIPEPKKITMGEGSFTIDRNTRVILADANSADDRFAAEDFIDDVKATAGVGISIGKGSARREITIGRIDLPAIAQLLKRSNAEVPPTLTGDGYVLVATTDRVIVAG